MTSSLAVGVSLPAAFGTLGPGGGCPAVIGTDGRICVPGDVVSASSQSLVMLCQSMPGMRGQVSAQAWVVLAAIAIPKVKGYERHHSQGHGSTKLEYQDIKNLLSVQHPLRWSHEILLKTKCNVQSFSRYRGHQAP